MKLNEVKSVGLTDKGTGVTAYPVRMSSAIREAMSKANVSDETIKAFEDALANAKVDGYAFSYAAGIERAFKEHGLEGVHYNMLYMMNNMRKWSGPEAANAKKILKKWKM